MAKPCGLIGAVTVKWCHSHETTYNINSACIWSVSRTKNISLGFYYIERRTCNLDQDTNGKMLQIWCCEAAEVVIERSPLGVMSGPSAFVLISIIKGKDEELTGA